MEERKMSLRKALSILSLSAIVGVFGIGVADAQVGLKPPFDEYAAKFSCGPVMKDADVAIGTYATTINIHNPQATIRVAFAKKFVIANPEGVQQGRIVVKAEALAPDAAMQVDCPVIYGALDVGTGVHIDGFIVIEVAPLPGTVSAGITPSLDVVGVYSARGASVSGLSVVNYEAKSIVK
jgi:hypothetical protein